MSLHKTIDMKETQFDKLIAEYKRLQVIANIARLKVMQYSDGHRYISCLRSYGSVQYESHTNTFVIQELCDEYSGDDGIVDVYTNNSNHNISTYGSVAIMTEEELVAMSVDNISMSRAMTNWITRSV